MSVEERAYGQGKASLSLAKPLPALSVHTVTYSISNLAWYMMALPNLLILCGHRTVLSSEDRSR